MPLAKGHSPKVLNNQHALVSHDTLANSQGNIQYFLCYSSKKEAKFCMGI